MNVPSRSDCRLLIIGGGVLERDGAGFLVGKAPIVEYVHDLSAHFRATVWATDLHIGSQQTSSRLDIRRVTPLIVKAGSRGLLHSLLSLSRVTDERTIVLLYLPNPWLSIAALLLRPRAALLAVYVANDYVQHSRAVARTRGRCYSQLYKLSHEVPIRLANGAIARGVALCRTAQALNRNVIETVPIGHQLSGVSASRAREALSRTEINVLFVGKVSREKGVDVLLQAIAKVKAVERERMVRLTVVGAGSQLNDMQKLATDLSIGGSVSFLGYVDDPSMLHSIYCGADFLVVPSTYPEGVPRVIEEGMVHELPVIAAGHRTILAEFSASEIATFPPGQVDELATVIQRLVQAPTLRADLIANAKARQRQTNISAAEQHARFLLHLAGSNITPHS